MSATVTLRRWSGTSGSPTKTDVSASTTVMVTEDAQYSAGSVNPIPIPANFGVLAAAITLVGATSTTVTETAGVTIPSTPFAILIDSEVINVTGRTPGTPATYTIVRGAAGTTAATHLIAATVSGVNLSYWVAFRLSADTTPTGTINNIKAYSDGVSNQPTGVLMYGNQATSYVQASGTSGTSGIMLNTTNYATMTAPVSLFTFTSAATLAVTGSISNPSTGDFGNHVAVQTSVAATCTSTGETTGELLTFIYDET